MAGLTNAQIAASVSDLVTKVAERDRQMQDWLTGTPEGGPYGDGRYPLTDYAGQTSYMKCPARLQWEADQAISTADGAKLSAEAARDEAASSNLSAETHKTSAEAAKVAALSAQQVAQQAQSAAQNSEANARVYSKRAVDAASAVADFDPEQPWAYKIAETAASYSIIRRFIKEIRREYNL